MEVYEPPSHLHQAVWDNEKLLLKELLRALSHISKQLHDIFMEIPT